MFLRNMGQLTVKQEQFVQKYVEVGVASEAYRQAYDCGGSSVETIANEAYKLTQNPDIAARIRHLEALRLKRHKSDDRSRCFRVLETGVP
jgi:phage terminase small subunit